MRETDPIHIWSKLIRQLLFLFKLMLSLVQLSTNLSFISSQYKTIQSNMQEIKDGTQKSHLKKKNSFRQCTHWNGSKMLFYAGIYY